MQTFLEQFKLLCNDCCDILNCLYFKPVLVRPESRFSSDSYLMFDFLCVINFCITTVCV